MKHKIPALKALRADILMDTKTFLQRLDAGASMEELSTILAEIKEKEALLFKREGSMMAPDLWELLHKRLAGRLDLDLPKQIE